MTRTKRLLIASAVAGATALVSFSADAFFGPFNMFNGLWGPGWGGWGGPWSGWGGPWGGYGYPYGWGGYPGWGYPGWGYPGWGYPYGGWGYPYGGWGYPYGLGYPLLTAPVAVAQPATTSSAK